MKKLFYVFLFLSGAQVAVTNDRYPFVNEPKLSWSEFENNFRKQYADLNIPSIVLLSHDLKEEYDLGPAIYFHEDAASDQLWQNIAITFEPIIVQLPVIIIHQKYITSSDALGYALLHEIGHHYYESARKQKEFICDVSNVTLACALLAGNIALMHYNYKQLLHKNLSAKHMAWQLSMIGALLFKNELFGQFINNFIAVRPNEYFADSFANNHATKNMLCAAKSLFSFEGLMDECKVNSMSEDEQKIMRYLVYNLYKLEDVIDIWSHPSRKKRYNLVLQALKERFNHAS